MPRRSLPFTTLLRAFTVADISNSTDKTPRLKIVSADLSASPPSFNIYGPDRDASGKQLVASTYSLDLDAVFHGDARMIALFVTQGFHAVASNAYTRMDNPTPGGVLQVFNKLAASIADGSWSPGRALGEKEPTDVVLAIAEATGQTVDAVQTRIDTELVRLPSGAPKLSSNGRTQRVFTDTMLANIAKDPKVAPIMARLARERADKMAKAAKDIAKGPTNGALDMFAPPQAETQQEAAN